MIRCTDWYILNVPLGTPGGKSLPLKKPNLERLVQRCLAAFVESGTIDLGLDQLARKAGTSKRMLIHYFGGREALEEQAMTLLEERLRAQFSPAAFPRGTTPEGVVQALWERATAVQSRGILRLLMDLSRRAWKGSARAKAFYAAQQKLWVDLLLQFIADEELVEEVLQLFQGCVLRFLVTGDREPGRRALLRALRPSRKPGMR